MSRSKKDILDTESMLKRLSILLQEHTAARDLEPGHGFWTRPRLDAESLRRVSMTLRAWHELECNEDVVRGKKGPAGGFVYDDAGAPYIARQSTMIARQGNSFYAIPDREAGARKRLAKIMARYPGLQAYVQGDPRGCALYILRPGDVPEGATVDSCYSRGLAVYR